MKLREIYDPAFFMARSLPPQDRHPEPPTNHSIIKPAKLNVEVSTSPQDYDPASAEQIVNAWRQIMDMELNVETVRAHFETLKRWHSRLSAVSSEGTANFNGKDRP